MDFDLGVVELFVALPRGEGAKHSSHISIAGLSNLGFFGLFRVPFNIFEHFPLWIREASSNRAFDSEQQIWIGEIEPAFLSISPRRDTDFWLLGGRDILSLRICGLDSSSHGILGEIDRVRTRNLASVCPRSRRSPRLDWC